MTNSVTLSSSAGSVSFPWTKSGSHACECLPACAGRVAIAPSASENGEVWELELQSKHVWEHDVKCELTFDASPLQPNAIHYPTVFGHLERVGFDEVSAGTFRGAGKGFEVEATDRLLALPCVILESAGGYDVLGLDPSFSVSFRRSAPDGRISIGWTWLSEAGLHESEKRRLFVARAPSPEAALDAFFRLALPEIPPAPPWVHDLYWNHYDYLSDNGDAWFADIDAVCEIVEPKHRHHVMFCLHGWYDRIGRFCYDVDTGKLDREWTAFPFIRSPEIFNRRTSWKAEYHIEPRHDAYCWRIRDDHQPVKLNWDEMRRRLRYAKDRGIKTCVYALTGMQSYGDSSELARQGIALDIGGGGWTGPDALPPLCMYNPLHPRVRKQFLGYIDALLREVGELADSLVMDEAYFVNFGQMGPAACPGYADRGQSTLIRDMAARCHAYRPDLSFFCADLLGSLMLQYKAFPYSLYCDGNYQDAHCRPTGWEAVRFASWRNPSLHCNWAPVTNFEYGRWAVLGWNMPLMTSAGSFGDDIGPAKYDAAMRQRLHDLWAQRLQQGKRARTLPIMR